ncbi:MAG: hypothetical protein VR69_01525 [Peptococcaceae bacterium BRH_c4b]|nr:MAG: hypothetical protein VR69_01525 [Peptococcaceae bacterium BRH_c4b]
MQNSALLRKIIFVIVILSGAFNISYGFMVFYHPEYVNRTVLVLGYWALPVMVGSMFLYAFLEKKSRSK